MTYNERVNELAMNLAGNPKYPKLATADDIEHMDNALLEKYKPLAIKTIEFAKEMYADGYTQAITDLTTSKTLPLYQHLTTLGLTE